MNLKVDQRHVKLFVLLLLDANFSPGEMLEPVFLRPRLETKILTWTRFLEDQSIIVQLVGHKIKRRFMKYNKYIYNLPDKAKFYKIHIIFHSCWRLEWMEWVGGVPWNLRCFTSHQQNKNLWQPCTKIRRSSLQWGRICWCWNNAMSKYVKCLIQIFFDRELLLSFLYEPNLIQLFFSL